MRGTIKKKGRLAMQGYKNREFVVSSDGIMRYGKPGDPKKWEKKIKLCDVVEIMPIKGEPKCGFTITKKDGRILYFAALNDEEKWKWITGFRLAVRNVNHPEWSLVDDMVNYTSRQMFIPLLKLSKVEMTRIWRWRFFYIDQKQAKYYADPSMGEELGGFLFSTISKASLVANTSGKELVLKIDVSSPEKRSYFFSHPEKSVLDELYAIFHQYEPKSIFSIWGNRF